MNVTVNFWVTIFPLHLTAEPLKRSALDDKMDGLERFIIDAKRSTYVGDGEVAASSRGASHDLAYQSGNWRYLDSYFGGTDFLGQEVVWHKDQPVWAMNYYGYILRPDLIDAHIAGRIIKNALSQLYTLDRFLGGFVCEVEGLTYQDETSGNFQRFRGREQIFRDQIATYELLYHGGNILD